MFTSKRQYTIKVIVLVGIIMAIMLPSWKITAQDNDGFYVDVAQNLGAISPYSYGTNHGPWAAVPADLLDEAANTGITLLRFPGGNWGDQNDLRPRHIDDLMRHCKILGCEPSLHVRLEGGTPEAAAELVRYANIEAEYNIRYWSIGNEPNLFDDYDTERYNREWRAIAEAMLEVDPDITLLGPELSQYPPNFVEQPKDSAGRDWMTEFLKANGDLVDIITVHRYPFPRGMNTVTTLDQLVANPPEWNEIIHSLRTLIHEVTGKDYPIGVTEFNSHWNSAYGQEASPDSLPNAIWLADVMGRLISEKVDIMTSWTLQTPNNFGGWGLFGQLNDIRPAYYTYQIYKQFGSTLLYSSSTTDTLTTIYAAQRDDGTLTLIMINLSSEEKTLPLQIDNFTAGGDAEVWLFDADHKAEAMGTQPLGESVTLPPMSVSLYAVAGG